MSKILFITEKVSFISEGIINHLKAQDFEVLTVKPDVTAISNFLKEDKGDDDGIIDPEVAALLSQEGGEGGDAQSGGEKLKEKAGKGMFWALLLFVGIPLPGTGAWTGTLAASLLDLDFKKSIIAITCGVLLAAVIITVATLLGVAAFVAVA